MRLVPAVLTLVSAVAGANPEYVNTRYGLTQLPASYTSVQCNDCHVGDSTGGLTSGPHPWAPALNAFGLAYRTNGWSTQLRNADTDGDGTNNHNELSAPGSAGFPTGASGCDALACATDAGTHVSCTGNVRCLATHQAGPASTGANPTGNNYQFAFSCVAGAAPEPVNSDTDWSDRCLDVNECVPGTCAPGTCTQRPLDTWAEPGYDCTCPLGYAAMPLACMLVDACAAGTHNCGPLATCVDTPGNSSVYVCQCPPGYAGNGQSGPGGTGCVNINECTSMPGVCGVGTCVENHPPPGYTCECPPSYAFNGTTCVVGTACTVGTDDCVPLAVCMEAASPPGFTCSCPTGYEGDGRDAGSGCTDINECATLPGPCAAANSACVDLPGSFSCVCAAGFEGDGETCSDLDECDAGTHTCDATQRCVNLPGDWACESADAGTEDAGLSGDAGTITNDAGAQDDAGANTHDAGNDDDDALPTGCGCASGGEFAVLALLAALCRANVNFTTRRRRWYMARHEPPAARAKD